MRAPMPCTTGADVSRLSFLILQTPILPLQIMRRRSQTSSNEKIRTRCTLRHEGDNDDLRSAAYFILLGKHSPPSHAPPNPIRTRAGETRYDFALWRAWSYDFGMNFSMTC